ncbi:MAG TPA: S-layer homology domain-containing protein [Bacilli bacterium]|nr:S-layer homology domain-containing protein [Bacilli bacterium]
MNKMMRRGIGLLFGLLLTTTTITSTMTTTYAAGTTQPTTPFSDLGDSFAKPDILTLAAKGVVKGYPDGTFRPQDPVTRAEFAAMLLRAKEMPPSLTYSGAFRDVQRGAWFMPYAELSYRLGITNGTSATTFSPQRAITREEMIKMVVSALGRESETARHLSYAVYSKPVLSYKDCQAIARWAVKPIAYASIKGMIKGTNDGRVLPKRVATRAEVAAFLNRSVMKENRGQLPVPVSRGGHLLAEAKKEAVATAYTYSGKLSYTGLPVREGLVAVDPDKIPLGSHLYIPGYGFGVAGDTGGKINDMRVDLYHDSYRDAINFGRKDVDVYVLD